MLESPVVGCSMAELSPLAVNTFYRFFIRCFFWLNALPASLLSWLAFMVSSSPYWL